MKVALLAPEFIPPWGGVGVYSYELARHLSLLGAEVHVITPAREGDDREFLSSLSGKVRIHHLSQANDTFFYNLKFQAALFTGFMKLQRMHRFEIVHATNLVQMPDVFLKLRDIGVPSLTTVHSTFLGQSRVGGQERYNGKNLARVERLSRVFSPVIQMMEKGYMKRTKHFIFVSRWVKGIAGAEGPVIHNGVDHVRFSPRNGYSQSGKIPTVMFAGRLIAMKGLDTLIEAAAPLLQKKRIRIILSGPGDTLSLKKRLARFGDSVTVSGPVPYHKMHSMYAKTDIFVLPSLSESFPLSVLEAMSCGIPVVASNVGGIPEMMKDGKEGFMVRPGDAVKLRKALVTLIDDQDLRKRMGKAGRKTITGNFTAEKMARETMDEYERIL